MVTDVRGHYVLVSNKPPQEIAMSVRGNSLKGKAKVVKVAASGLFLSIASCKGLGTLGTSVAKWVHVPRALAQRASHFGSS